MNSVKFLSEDSKLILKTLNNLYYIVNLDICICDRMGMKRGIAVAVGVTLIHPKDGKVKKLLGGDRGKK